VIPFVEKERQGSRSLHGEASSLVLSGGGLGQLSYRVKALTPWVEESLGGGGRVRHLEGFLYLFFWLSGKRAGDAVRSAAGSEIYLGLAFEWLRLLSIFSEHARNLTADSPGTRFTFSSGVNWKIESKIYYS